jgi:hypothetical protein
MSGVVNQVEVYIEAGQTRKFAIVPEWPGWCRSGRDETSALQSLILYGPRYADALNGALPGFNAPSTLSNLHVVERLPGNATTDFGAPDLILPADTQPVQPIELERWQIILEACWKTFDKTLQSANYKVLRKGPRGGGRDLLKITEHVRDVEIAYLSSLGGNFKTNPVHQPDQALAAQRQVILTTLALSAHGQIPTHGPRGGLRWTPRYFVRRLAWHVLDHIWEIEDRAE